MGNANHVYYPHHVVGLSLCADLFYYQGVRQIHESSRVPVIASMETVMATVLGMLVLGEKLTVTRYLGIIIVMFSIVLMQQRKIVPDATAQNNSAM